jgi:hypothetical protein
VTISPPPNVKTGPIGPGRVRVLASGLDGLVLSMNIIWQNETFFDLLDEMKELAKGGGESPVYLYDKDSKASVLNVKPHGGGGYEWLLTGHEFALKVGKWTRPKQRPSVMVEIRSETLWHQGPALAVSRLCQMLENVFAVICDIKVSRVDPCVDILLPEASWGLHVADHIVSRAVKDGLYRCNRTPTGITIGSGDLLARLYDKPREIIMKSNKVWMFDIWGIDAVPVGHVLIRNEFQLRREALKELGIDSFTDLQAKAAGLWKYCTRDWLKIQDDPSKHHTMQHTLDWWKMVQNGFDGAQEANALVRVKSIQADWDRLLQQMTGYMASLTALSIQKFNVNGDPAVSVAQSLGLFRDGLAKLGTTDAEFKQRVEGKIARYHRAHLTRGKTVEKHTDNGALGATSVSCPEPLPET